MTFVSGLPLFDMTALWRGGASISAFALNQSTDKLEAVFRAPAASTLTRLGFLYGTRTGTPPTYKISLQGVDASGNPDGTVKGGGTPASTTFTPPASTAWNSTWRWHTLDNSYTATRGEMLAWVIEYSAGTVDGSNNSTFNYRFNGTVTTNFPYITQNDAGARTRINAVPCFGFGSAGVAYGWPVQSAASTNVNSGSSPNEYGLKFTLPAWMTGGWTLLGVRAMLTATATTSIKAQLYSGGNAGDTTVLQDVTQDMDILSTVTKGYCDFYFDEATLSSLTAGNSYRFSLAPQDGTNISLDTLAAAVSADWEPWPGGIDVYTALSTRGGANWTDDATKRMGLGLIFADTGSGGSSSPIGIRGLMTGGRL